MNSTATIPWGPFSEKHRAYIRQAKAARMMCAEGAIRSGKTIDHCIIAQMYLETCADKIHLASGSSMPNAKAVIGDCNGFGLEHLFRGRCRWGKYKANEALFLHTKTGEKVVIFVGGGKADSYKKILGNSYGLWIATEINEHYDSDDPRTSFIKVAEGRQLLAQRPLTLWDLNPSAPRHRIYDYIDGYKDAMPGYVYEHFTIRDNANLTPERYREILSRYAPGTVRYRRDINGERCVAQGLIYPQYADDPQRWYIDKADVLAGTAFAHVLCGVDFGGNKSAHAYTLTGITEDWRVVVLRTKTLPATGMSVEQLIVDFERWAAQAEADYGVDIDYVYADDAEQAIINSMYQRTRYKILNSIKGEIIDRIRCTDLLLNQGRIALVRGECDPLEASLCDAVWDDTKTEDKRLDKGTYNVDQLDSFEYSWSAYIPQLLRE